MRAWITEVAAAFGIVAMAIGLVVLALPANGDGLPREAATLEAFPVADELADRTLAWVEHRRDAVYRFSAFGMRKGWPSRDWVRSELVPAALEAAQGARYPDDWPDAEVLLAKSWFESRWRPDEIGRFVSVNGRVVRGTGGEVGVAQIKPRVCRRYLRPGEDCADTRVNLRVAATILREHYAVCVGRPAYALRFYATGNGCGRPRNAERTVMNWAEQIRREAL